MNVSQVLIAAALCPLAACLLPGAERQSPTSFRASSANSPVVMEIASTASTLGRTTIDIQLVSLVDAAWVSIELELPRGVRLISQELPGGPLKTGGMLSGTATIQLPPAVRRGRCNAEIILTALLNQRTQGGQVQTLSTQSAIRFGCHEERDLIARSRR